MSLLREKLESRHCLIAAQPTATMNSSLRVAKESVATWIIAQIRSAGEGARAILFFAQVKRRLRFSRSKQRLARS